MARQAPTSPRIFKTAWFSEAAKQARIADTELCAAIRQVMRGQADDLGGGVFKKRLNDNRHRSIILAKAGRFGSTNTYSPSKTGPTSMMLNWRLFALSPKAIRHSPMRTSAPCWKMESLWKSAMTTKAKFKTGALEAIHASAQALFEVGAIDKVTMRQFDQACLATPCPLEPAQIKQIRENNQVSQPVFARYLNTSASTVRKWEAGTKRPSGVALKLLAVVEKHGLGVLT